MIRITFIRCEALEEYAADQKPPAAPLVNRVRLTMGLPVYYAPVDLAKQSALAAKVREGVDKLEACRVKLGDQFKAEFLPIK